MSDYIVIPFLIDGSVTLAEFDKIRYDLSDLDINLDVGGAEFDVDALIIYGGCCDRQTLKAAERYCKKTKGIEIDWSLEL